MWMCGAPGASRCRPSLATRYHPGPVAVGCFRRIRLSLESPRGPRSIRISPRYPQRQRRNGPAVLPAAPNRAVEEVVAGFGEVAARAGAVTHIYRSIDPDGGGTR